MATLRQLAELSGYSIATVSLALRDHPRIPESTRQCIKALAEENHYHPLSRGRGAAHDARRDIYCLLPGYEGFFGQILNAVEKKALSQEYNIRAMFTIRDAQHTCAQIRWLIEQRIGGLIIAYLHPEPIPKTLLLELRSREIPVVGLDFTTSEVPIDLVRTDETQHARLLVDYLLRLGHQHIGFIDIHGHRAADLWTRNIVNALRRRGLPSTYHYSYQFLEAAQRMALAPAEFPLARFLRKYAAPPTALITFYAPIALDLLMQAYRLGIAVPHDLSLICSGEGPNALDLATPCITRSNQYPEEIGALAFELLLQRMNGSFTDGPILREVPTSMVIRNSAGPPADGVLLSQKLFSNPRS